MAFDTFISYASKDKPAADAACAVLERAGIRCWIAPRDIKPGGEYGEAIIEAIDQCRVMVLIFSSSANDSRQVHREIERAVSKGVTIIPLRIEEVLPTKSMEYFLGAIHWLDALTPPFEKHLQQLAEAVRALLQIDVAGRPAPLRENTSQASTTVQHAGPAMQRDGTAAWSAGARRLVLLLLGVAAACIGLLIGGVWLYLTREPAAAIAPAQAVAVHAASVKDIFQKYNLIGTFAQDCSKPPTVQTPPNGTPQNWWFVNRLIDDNHAERDFMNSPTERGFVIIIDGATELQANQIRVTGLRDGTISVDNVWHIDKNRTLTWQGIGDTKGNIANGKYTQTGNAVPWLTRCGASRP
jgi:hypothetical protein